jgi:hypothetical protein
MYDFASIDGAFGIGTAARAMLDRNRKTSAAESERRIRDDPRKIMETMIAEARGF